MAIFLRQPVFWVFGDGAGQTIMNLLPNLDIRVFGRFHFTIDVKGDSKWSVFNNAQSIKNGQVRSYKTKSALEATIIAALYAASRVVFVYANRR